MFLGIPQLDKFFSSLSASKLDDFTDRCNYYYTVLALIFFSLLIGSKQTFGEPIRCLVDQQYAASWIAYVHDYCFISERYSLTMPAYENKAVARFDSTEAKSYENYYQWVPFLLAVQAVLFYLPHFLWRIFQKMSSLDLDMIVSESEDVRSLVGEKRRASIAKLSSYVTQYLNYSPTESCGIDVGCVGRFGSFSSLLYVLLKVANTINVYVQLLVINNFVGDGTFMWAVELAANLMRGKDWTYTGHFPRVVFCDYDKATLGNVQHKTVQCALAINILNEKVFVLLTLWLMLLLVMTALNALFTFCTLFVPAFREGEVLCYLEPALFMDDKTNVDSVTLSRKDTLRIQGSEGGDSGINIDGSVNAGVRRRLNSNVSEGRIRDNGRTGADICTPAYSAEERALLKEFTRSALCIDGVQLLRFINSHAGAMTARDIAVKLFHDFVYATTINARVVGNGFPNAGMNAMRGGRDSTEMEPLLGSSNTTQMGDLPRSNSMFNNGSPSGAEALAMEGMASR